MPAIWWTAAPVHAQTAGTDDFRVWDSVFAGRSELSGNAAKGTQSIVASVVGTTFGIDKQFDTTTLAGLSLGLSHQTFSSNTGNGASDDVTATLYARHSLFDNAYIAEALGYGWHHVDTRRTVTVFRTEILEADFHAHDFGGRIEGGYNFLLDPQRGQAVSPFAAFVGDSYAEPAYGETAKFGVSNYAVSFASDTIGTTHVEFGARYYDSFALVLGGKAVGTVSLDAVAAWQHELDDNPFIQASFQTSPGTDFVLRGTSPAMNSALLGLGARLQAADGLTFGTRADARLGVGTTIVSGSVDLTYRW